MSSGRTGMTDSKVEWSDMPGFAQAPHFLAEEALDTIVAPPLQRIVSRYLLLLFLRRSRVSVLFVRDNCDLHGAGIVLVGQDCWIRLEGLWLGRKFSTTGDPLRNAIHLNSVVGCAANKQDGRRS